VATDTAGLRDDLRARLAAALGGAYAVERELGGGGMSRVFVAEDARLGRRVVVKVLAADLTAGRSAARFEREIRLAAGLQHPNVVPVLAAGERGGLAYYVMPYVEEARRHPDSNSPDQLTTSLVNAASVDARIGRRDLAVARLTEALRLRAGSAVSGALLRADPSWAPLRGHPGFERLLAGQR
jgi:hypothetical protein